MQKSFFMFRKNLVELQLSLLHVSKKHIAARRTQQSVAHFNCFSEVELVEQNSMTAEQQACAEHFLTYTTRQKFGKTGRTFTQDGTQSHLDILASLQREDFIKQNSNWNDIQTSTFSTTISRGNTKDYIKGI